MSERDRLNSILPFFLPSCCPTWFHFNFRRANYANLFIFSELIFPDSRRDLQILQRDFLIESIWIEERERERERIFGKQFAVAQILFHISISMNYYKLHVCFLTNCFFFARIILLSFPFLSKPKFRERRKRKEIRENVNWDRNCLREFQRIRKDKC